MPPHLSFALTMFAAIGCLGMTLRKVSLLLTMIPPEADRDPLLGRFARIAVPSDEPEIRSIQRSLFRWLASALLLLWLARIAFVGRTG